MNTHTKTLGLALGLFIILACGTPVATPDVGDMVTQTLQALTAVPTESQTEPAVAATESQQLTPDGTPVETAEVSFFNPNGVANDATSLMNSNVEYPYINPSFGDMPRHATVTLNLYALNGTVYQPQIMIFRAAEYSQYSELMASTVNTLQSLQYVDGQPLPEELNADFSAQIHAVNFKNGHGIRYLTQVFQNFNPVNNKELFYYYQGLTDDGQYFVQATLPINTAYLPADDNPNTPLPADGIPFNMDDFPGYLDAVKQKLNSTETFNFNPYLDALDEMIASMQVRGF
ncbi:MAG: hypothetical protein HYU84_04015 [Chloroflexi bacterium]|nr:hypothetical protein [Chloroflexota bacterium]MBI3167307.1 hypothetical protein [Chloroflexota bacterium]